MGFIRKRIKAFSNAFNGLALAFKTEIHFRIHILALLLVLNIGFYFQLNTQEWLAIILCSAFVISLELINSAIEKLCNIVSPAINPQIKFVKDVAAASVLVAALASLIVAYLVFWPHILSQWMS